MKRTTWIILGAAALAVILAVVLLSGGEKTAVVGQNILQNGDFAQAGDNGLPLHWYTEAYFQQVGTQYALKDGAAYIQSTERNDARFAQDVPVSPNTLYCLRGLVRASAEFGHGANLSVAGVYVFSEELFDTQGEYQELVLYGRTGANQAGVTVFARLGGYSGESAGEAWFKDITLTAVDSVPGGYYAQSWAEQAYEVPEDAQSERAETSWPLILLVALLYALLCCCAALYMQSQRDEQRLSAKDARHRQRFELYALLCGLALAFIARLIVASTVQGYQVDIGCFSGWARHMAQYGPAQFYQDVFINKTQFCDYPPGMLLLLWPLGALAGQSGVSEMALKLMPSVCDIASCVLLYLMARRRMPHAAAVALSLLYAFNPLTVLTGAAWGQMDSLSALTMLLVLYFALDNRWHIALPVFTLSALIKPQALMFGPLGLAALAVTLIAGKDKQTLRRALLGVLYSVLTAVLIVLPFAVGMPLSPDGEGFWLFRLYQNTMSYYDRATVNATNLYFLFGKNWVYTSAVTDGGAAAAAGALFLLPGIALALTHRRQERWAAGALLLAGVTAVLLGAAVKVSYAAFGTVMMAVCFLLSLWQYLRARDIRRLPLLGALLLICFYTSGIMMHERYLFTAVLLLYLAYATERDGRVLLLAALVTAAVFVNVGCALDGATRIGGVEGHLDAPDMGIQSVSAGLEYVNAFVMCVLMSFSLYLGFAVTSPRYKPLALRAPRVLFEQNAHSAAHQGEKPKVQTPPYKPSRMDKKDVVIMLGLTALYAALAFVNLGSLKAPQTSWVGGRNNSVVIALPENDGFEMLYYGGIHWSPSHFLIETSQDGVTYDAPTYGQMNEGDCFTWKYVQHTYDDDGDISFYGGKNVLHGRYVRISARSYQITLFETLFRDPTTHEVLKARVVSGEGGEALLDEQDTLERTDPGWYNSMYFDEIYHARTAYEHLHGLSVYETTHPPLGKVVMSWSVAIFGMTPFGWRFAGALMGVLMLPGMYMLGRLLTKKRLGAIAALLLMAFDCMHFAQTRIATIDSFVVLFIIWEFYFMFRYALLTDWTKPFWKSLVPLLFSGLFMGLGFASKWTGAYAGIGLALMFFWALYRHAKAARETLQRREITKNILLTLAACLVFFIAVPLVIYYASYIPYFRSSGGVTVKKVIEAAFGSYFTTGVMGGMLGYHSTPGLGMDHFYYSPWYQWPLSIKPMWYFSDSYKTAAGTTTILSFGNIAVWWSGLAALVTMMGVWLWRHVQRDGRSLRVTLHARRNDMRPALLLLAFFVQYLPWMLVPRGTYIYHYFPCVPIVILCIVVCFDLLREKYLPDAAQAVSAPGYADMMTKYARASELALVALVAVAGVLFVGFFPYCSGLRVSETWLEAMRWFGAWLYY